ncbi:hypothetical protein CGCF415_v001355 [Colletotrichum fructicola]|nr:hypothetical protein CGCF415_v001355 [Colletotrichum fructicola]KAF4943050.1 hypothetical protein CGCF245_v000201 [Colletotrichum fructicola]KAF5498909.1 hypothetical protein CGCF413_v006715 [Colletotrichum fructicola]KAI8280043.1 hypothetical protein K4K60_005182 [Colletotrichum sp. SAR11_57]
MNSKIDPPTDVAPEVAPDSVKEHTSESATEPMTDPSPESATGDEAKLTKMFADIAVEPEADDGFQQSTRPALESTSKASANQPSTAQITLPPQPSPPPGFRYSENFPGLLVSIDRSITSDTKAWCDAGSSRSLFGGPVDANYDTGSRNGKRKGLFNVNLSKTIDADPTIEYSDRPKSQSSEDFEAALGLSSGRCSDSDLPTGAPPVVTEDLTTVSDALNDDNASFHTAAEHQSDEDADDKMIPNSNPVYRIKRFQNRDFSEQQRAIIDVLATAVASIHTKSSEEAAAKIDSLCPPSDQEEEVKDWLWTLWEILIDIARFGDFRSVYSMFWVVSSLHRQARGYVKIGSEERRLWKDLPMFSYCMDAAFCSDPTTGYTKLTWESRLAWEQLNSFGGLCLASAIGGPHHHAMNAMRSALEEEISPDIDIAECRMSIACEWSMRLASKPLLRWALENVGAEHPKEDSMDYEEPGPLYHGPPMMCLQRWGFWIERLEQLSKGDDRDHELIRGDAKTVVEYMQDAEKELGHTLSD